MNYKSTSGTGQNIVEELRKREELLIRSRPELKYRYAEFCKSFRAYLEMRERIFGEATQKRSVVRLVADE